MNPHPANALTGHDAPSSRSACHIGPKKTVQDDCASPFSSESVRYYVPMEKAERLAFQAGPPVYTERFCGHLVPTLSPKAGEKDGAPMSEGTRSSRKGGPPARTRSTDLLSLMHFLLDSACNYPSESRMVRRRLLGSWAITSKQCWMR